MARKKVKDNTFRIANRIIREAERLGKEFRPKGAPIFSNQDTVNSFSKGETTLILKLLKDKSINRVFLANSDADFISNLKAFTDKGWRFRRVAVLKSRTGRHIEAIELTYREPKAPAGKTVTVGNS